ncbi:hypothetical protein PAECIP111890_04751 [Paenibacillus sp. JJ-223]|nr:hypothetical protein PAECIP111890_04751 [Paenibacillus sp. JJ-223]
MAEVDRLGAGVLQIELRRNGIAARSRSAIAILHLQRSRPNRRRGRCQRHFVRQRLAAAVARCDPVRVRRPVHGGGIRIGQCRQPCRHLFKCPAPRSPLHRIAVRAIRSGPGQYRLRIACRPYERERTGQGAACLRHSRCLRRRSGFACRIYGGYDVIIRLAVRQPGVRIGRSVHIGSHCRVRAPICLGTFDGVRIRSRNGVPVQNNLFTAAGGRQTVWRSRNFGFRAAAVAKKTFEFAISCRHVHLGPETVIRKGWRTVFPLFRFRIVGRLVQVIQVCPSRVLLDFWTQIGITDIDAISSLCRIGRNAARARKRVALSI